MFTVRTAKQLKLIEKQIHCPMQPEMIESNRLITAGVYHLVT